jgi:hypothetical protein
VDFGVAHTELFGRGVPLAHVLQGGPGRCEVRERLLAWQQRICRLRARTRNQIDPVALVSRKTQWPLCLTRRTAHNLFLFIGACCGGPVSTGRLQQPRLSVFLLRPLPSA